MEENELNLALDEVVVKAKKPKTGSGFWGKVKDLLFNASYDSTPSDIQNSEAPLSTSTAKAPRNPIDQAALSSTITSVLGGVTSIWTSINDLRNHKLDIQKEGVKIKQLQEQGQIEEERTLQKALDLKIAQTAVLEKKEKSNAIIRSVVYFLLFGVVSLILWLIFGRKKKDIVYVDQLSHSLVMDK